MKACALDRCGIANCNGRLRRATFQEKERHPGVKYVCQKCKARRYKNLY